VRGTLRTRSKKTHLLNEPLNGIVKELALFFQNEKRGVEKLQTVEWSGYELNNPDF